ESVSASVSESVSLSASPADSSDRPSAAPPAGPAASSAVGPSSSGPVPSPRLRSVSAMVPDRSGAGFAGESRSTSSDAIIRQPSGGRGTAAGPHSRKECGPVPRTGRSGLLLGLRIGRSGAVVVPGRRRRRLGAGQCDGGLGRGLLVLVLLVVLDQQDLLLVLRRAEGAVEQRGERGADERRDPEQPELTAGAAGAPVVGEQGGRRRAGRVHAGVGHEERDEGQRGDGAAHGGRSERSPAVRGGGAQVHAHE